MAQARFISALFVAAVVGGCGGGGGTTPPPPPPVTNNLSAEAFQVTSSNPTIGNPVRVSLSIAAVQDTDDVSVGFYAVGATGANNGQYSLGTQRIARVQAGTHPYELELAVPSSIPAGGAYLIGAIVDLASAVAESDEDDNAAEVQATLALPQNPNLFIAEVLPDSASVELDEKKTTPSVAGDVYDSDAASTISFGVEGATTPVAVEAFADLRLTTSTGRVTSMPLYLWNSDALPSGRYMNAYGVDPTGPPGNSGAAEWLPLGNIAPQSTEIGAEPALTTQVPDVAYRPVNKKSARIEFYFPGGLAKELIDFLNTRIIAFGDLPTFAPPDLTLLEIARLRAGLNGDPSRLLAEICIRIRSVDLSIVDSTQADNEDCKPVTLVVPPDDPVPVPPPIVPPVLPYSPAKQINPVSFRLPYSPTPVGGGSFGVSLSLLAEHTADNRGLIYSASGALPLTVFGQSVDLLGVTGRAQLLPVYSGAPPNQTPGFTLQVRALGQVIYTNSQPSGSFRGCACFVREVTRSRTIAVGPVPFTGTGTVQGTIGAEYDVAWAPNSFYDLRVGPTASVEAEVSGGVGITGFSAGAYGSLSPFLSEKFTAAATAQVNVIDSGAAPSTAAVVRMRQSLNVVNNLQGPVGEVGFYGEYSYPSTPTCRVLGRRVPCGWPTIKRVREYLPLERWRTFRKVDTLFNAVKHIGFVSSSSGGQVTYYAPDP